MANNRKHIVPLKVQLDRKRKEYNSPWNTIEQDYVLSWVLWGISQIPKLSETLVFKGGTCLKKIYFKNYRFSEDLDFSCLDSAPSGAELKKLLKAALDVTKEEMAKTIPTPVIDLKKYTESKEHPENQEAFIVRVQLPWHRTPFVRVMLEITRNELIAEIPKKYIILNEYENLPKGFLLSYSLEEIAAEKLRAILQNIIKLHERGWTRSRARDYYDLWNIFQEKEFPLKKEEIVGTLNKKCSFKDIRYENSADFFDEKVLLLVEKDWDQWLKPLIKDLPEVDLVIKDLKIFLSELLD